MNGLKDYEALPQGTQFTFKVQAKNGAFKEGKAKVEEKTIGLARADGKDDKIIKYKEIQKINGDNCEILHVGIKPEKALKDEDPNCCI